MGVNRFLFFSKIYKDYKLSLGELDSGMKRIIKQAKIQKWVSSKNTAKIFSAGFVLLLVALSFSSAKMQGAVASDITVDSIVNLTNQSRWNGGEGVLSLNMKLSEAAKSKAEDMIAKNYFSHNSPDGKTPWTWIDKENYDYNYAGENLAMDFHSVQKLEDAWMASPTHRANILNEKYKDIGVAVEEGTLSGHDTTLVVVMFGSGDKNISSAPSSEKGMTDVASGLIAKTDFPKLPLGEKKEKNISAQAPIITSPQAGAVTSNSEIEIQGRANPGEAVSIYDNQSLVAMATADQDGWFSAEGQNFSEGNHQLTAANKKTFSQSPVEFFVDQQKPEIDFHLFVDQVNPGQFFLAVKSNKNNCTVQLDGDTRQIGSSSEVLFSINSKKSSAVLRISDGAGNKNFKQVNMANFYFSEKKSKMELKQNLALKNIIPEKMFSIDSGRQAIKDNLGLVPHNFLASAISQ
jgi:uncharacterized protein YkwD